MGRRRNYYDIVECHQAVLFVRVSSNKQEFGASLDAQLDALQNYCQRKGLEVKHIFNITESSTRGDRKKFHEMLEFVTKQRQKTAIVVYCVDRLQRGFNEYVELDNLRKQDKTELHFYKEGFCLNKESDAVDIMRWDMGILSGQMYINAMKDNVKRSMNYNWSQGKWQGLAPIGYLNAKDENKKSTLVLDTFRAPLIRHLFEEYATEKYSLQGLTDLAKSLGLTSKERNPRCDSTNYRKYGYLSRSSIAKILNDPFYYGVMNIKNMQYPHIYPRIIDKTLFDKVQRILAIKRAHPVRDQKYGILPFTFRGLIYCAQCGCAISSEMHKKGDHEYIYLRCSHLKGNCSQGIVNENIILEQLDRELFSKIKITPTMLAALKKNVLSRIESEDSINTGIRRQNEKSIRDIEVKLERLFDIFLEGNISNDKYKTEKTKLEAQKEELKRKNQQFSSISNTVRQKIDDTMDFVANISALMQKASASRKNELLKLLIYNCTLDGTKIHYKIKPPFDKLLACPDLSKWADISVQNIECFADEA